MKNNIFKLQNLFLVFAMFIVENISVGQVKKEMKNIEQTYPQGIFPRGEKLPEQFSQYFIGQAYLAPLTSMKDLNTPVSNVTFEPSCRNNWHSHTGGQMLIVVSGRGYYQERGKKAQELFPGDVVEIAPNVEHWHGAAPDSWFSHLAVQTNANTNKNTWLEPVDDAQYALATAKTKTQLNVSETAKTNRKLLFSNETSDLVSTDPELVTVFDNFAFDQVISHDELPVKTRAMTNLASCIAQQAIGEYREMLGAALNVGISAVQIKEILYQCVPYVGMAKVLDFIYATNDVFTKKGIKLPLEGQSTTTPENRYEKGLAIQGVFFGQEFLDGRYKNSPENQRHIVDYLSSNCFGDYYTRGALDGKTRELLTFTILLSMGGCEPQLKGHIAANANIGNDKQMLLNVITQLVPYVGYPRSLNAIRCLNEVLPEK